MVDTHKSATFGLGLNHIRLQHFHVILHVKRCSLIWSNPRPNVTLECGWTQNQMLHSYVCQPMTNWYSLMWYPPIQAMRNSDFQSISIRTPGSVSITPDPSFNSKINIYQTREFVNVFRHHFVSLSTIVIYVDILSRKYNLRFKRIVVW